MLERLSLLLRGTSFVNGLKPNLFVFLGLRSTSATLHILGIDLIFEFMGLGESFIKAPFYTFMNKPLRDL